MHPTVEAWSIKQKFAPSQDFRRGLRPKGIEKSNLNRRIHCHCTTRKLASGCVHVIQENPDANAMPCGLRKTAQQQVRRKVITHAVVLQIQRTLRAVS